MTSLLTFSQCKKLKSRLFWSVNILFEIFVALKTFGIQKYLSVGV